MSKTYADLSLQEHEAEMLASLVGKELADAMMHYQIARRLHLDEVEMHAAFRVNVLTDIENSLFRFLGK